MEITLSNAKIAFYRPTCKSKEKCG